MAKITVYKNSAFASTVSIIGYLFAALGVAFLFGGLWLAGIVFIALAIGANFLAPSISENKKFETWKAQIRQQNLEPVIQASVEAAVQIYQTYPSSETLEYISRLNPSAGEYIQQSTGAKPKKNNSMLIIGIVVIGVGIIMFLGAPRVEEITKLSKIEYDQIEEDKVYFVDSFYVGDCYAFQYEERKNSSIEGDEKVTDNYYVVIWYDDDDKICAASLEVSVKDDLNEQLEAFINDESKYLGDFELSGYFKTDEIETKLVPYLKEMIDFYNEELFEEEKIEVVKINFKLIYDEDYDYEKSMEMKALFTKVFATIICIIGGIIILVNKKKG